MADRPFDKASPGAKKPPRKVERSSRGARGWAGNELMDSAESLRHRVKEWEANLNQIEEDIDRLKVLYDQFSIGVLKRVPTTERIRLERMMRAYALPRGAPARIKFKMTNLMQRYTLLKTYWDRIEREIEQGKYRQRLGGRTPEPVRATAAVKSAPAKKKAPKKAPKKSVKKKKKS